MAVNFGIQISELIAFLHNQKPVPILYLDLKPQNIVINNGTIYLIDFGNSMFVNSHRSYMSGTKGYAAPEQYDFTDIDFATDVYGIGALLYFMVTGRNGVFDEKVNFDTNILVSEGFKNIVNRCMAPRETRTADVLWVAENLNEIIREKIRKKNVKKSNENLMENPLVISVVGAQRHIGVTHFALALTCRLNENGIKTVYEDKGGKIIKAIYDKCDKCKLSSGIYYYENIMMKYSYSEIVALEHNVNCKIIDWSEENVCNNSFNESDAVILIAGGKPWELDCSKEVICHINSLCNLKKRIILWNFIENKEADCVPAFCNPFERTADVNGFIDKVIRMVFEEGNVRKKEDRKRIFRFFTRKK